MADIKISELPVVTTSAAADSIPIVQGGVTSRIHPGPAGGLDADTVSAYGIGANPPYKTGIDCLSDLATGFYSFDTSCTNLPTGSGYWYGFAIRQSASQATRMMWNLGTLSQIYQNNKNITWNGWTMIADGGNGVQPPAPKSVNDSLTTNIIGRMEVIATVSTNQILYLPAGGAWCVFCAFYADSLSGVMNAVGWGNLVNTVWAGGTAFLSAQVDSYGIAFAKRES